MKPCRCAPYGSDNPTTALVMRDSPTVLSMGKRCLHEGYSFQWMAGRMPTLTLPDGTVITLNVTNGVPLLPMDNSGIAGAAPPACAGSSSSESVEEEVPTKEAENGGKPPALGADKIPEEHFLTHLPKHPKCPACQAARMQNRQCRRQKHDENEEPKTKKFGDHIIADHIARLAEEAESLKVTRMPSSCATLTQIGWSAIQQPLSLPMTQSRLCNSLSDPEIPCRSFTPIVPEN